MTPEVESYHQQHLDKNPAGYCGPPTAQEVFVSMMRARIAPALRALGFKGSGQVFELPHPASWALLGFQRSAYNTAGHVEFTVDVTATGKSSWTQARERLPHLPARPNPNVVYGPAAWHSRIGSLLPAAQDTWWTISPKSHPSRTAGSVMAAITGYALPAIREQLPS
ncbi:MULTISPECIES: DUF4304 domain-containing protein [unclassified Streptomyces]|uniref:DUF4304 domain-containing protein n=1 Tax=unclassified Streptomyces TaxID=2593676 RepID=UPI003431C95D